MKIEIKQNKALDTLLKELEASPQRRGGVLTRSFKEGVAEFYSIILGSYATGGIPVWSGWAKSAFDLLADEYGVDIDWSTNPSIPRPGSRNKPTLEFAQTATAPQVQDRIFGQSGQWVWSLDIDIPHRITNQQYVEANEFSGPTPYNSQIPRPWNIFEKARKKAVRHTNKVVERRLQNFVNTRLRAVQGSRSR